jgi:heterodisulfide reductase subunit A2
VIAMAHMLIIGGGLSGCTTALELAKMNHRVTIIEKSDIIGGKVRYYGCKSTDSCNNCGLCLIGGLWEEVENNNNIEILKQTNLIDITGNKGDFRVVLKDQEGFKTLTGISHIVVSIGFERSLSQSYSNLELTKSKSIISGFDIENYILNRNKNGFLSEVPSKVAFIQCFGSRDIQEKALYCSRVCCGYATRAAKTLRYCYPESEITFFYTDMQYVREGQYLDTLTKEGFEFIKCRPTKIKTGKPAKIVFEQLETGKVVEREFDLIVLSEGIHAAADSEKIAELCNLRIDDNGFLGYVRDGEQTGVYVLGCASGPKRSEEVYNEAKSAARQILIDLN